MFPLSPSRRPLLLCAIPLAAFVLGAGACSSSSPDDAIGTGSPPASTATSSSGGASSSSSSGSASSSSSGGTPAGYDAGGQALPSGDDAGSDDAAVEAAADGAAGDGAAGDGEPGDGGHADGASDGATDAPTDGGAVVNGCTAADYALHDESGANGKRTITFANAAPATQYAPNCMEIAKGQSVTWKGDFKLFPLDSSGGSANSPIKTVDNGNTTTVTFPVVGTYGFDSSADPKTMFGAIEVTP
jgi:plastocyanin